MTDNIDILQTGRTGPYVLFLHGIGGNHGNFQTLMSGMEGVRAIALNLPGYGDSLPLEGGLSFPALATWLSRFIETLGEPVHLVGHSIGGMVALEHTASFPEQVASLSMLGATAAFGGRDDSFKEAFLKLRLAPLDAGQTMAEIARSAVPTTVGANASQAVKQAAIHSMSSISEQVWRDILNCLVTFNRREDIASIPQRVCVISGSEDTNAPAKTLAKMAEKFQQAEYHCLEGVGHLLPLEAPREISQILDKFIAR